MAFYYTGGENRLRKRKTIAVIAADISNDYMNRILLGISEQSKALGYDVYAFVMAFSVDGEIGRVV